MQSVFVPRYPGWVEIGILSRMLSFTDYNQKVYHQAVFETEIGKLLVGIKGIYFSFYL
jgi:hypothetical protein